MPCGIIENYQIFNSLLQNLWINDIILPTTTEIEKAHRVRTDRLFSNKRHPQKSW
jgi:hypothetical protein